VLFVMALICIFLWINDVDVLIGYLRIFFEEMSIQVDCPFLTRLFICLLLCCRNSLYILDINSLLYMRFSNVLPSVDCLFTLLIMSCDAQMFLILR